MIGSTISHYRILERIGGGGMGVVYKAEDTRLKRIVALKFLPPELTRDPEAKERFVHEARAASALDHNNICNVHEIGETDEGQMFIAMACYDGEALKKKIERGPMKLEEVFDFSIQIAQGLAKAHEQGIIHRDIKPANVIITNDGVVKILDFGLAKLAGRTVLTKTGTSVGTVEYMSPEQARGEAVDERTDIWSLGVVLYEMITGQRPFKGEYENAVVYSVLSVDPEPPTGLRTGVPMELERIVKKSMSKDARDRYQRVDEMIVDLRSVRKEMESGKMKAPPSRVKPPQKKRWYLYAIAAILLIAIVSAAVLHLIPGRTQTIHSIAVLPLSNYSGDASQEYFVDGMTEALIADLSQIGALRVISRTSVMRYKNIQKPLPEIAKELNVDAVIEGSVLRSGERVRITAQLIQGTSDQHLWANSYERDARDIFALQKEVAKAIAGEIRIKLTPQQETSLAGNRQVNPAAHEAYLRGRYFLNRFKAEDTRKALEQFGRAIEMDSSFAPAYAGQSYVYILMGVFGSEPLRDMVPKAKATAQRALGLDDNLGEAHAALGYAKLYFDWDWPAAAKELQRALDLGPNDGWTRHGYADYLLVMGRLEESLEQVKLGRQYDPMSPLANAVVAGHLFFLHRYDEAIEECHKMFELDKNYPMLTFVRDALWEKGMYEESFAEYKRTWGRDPKFAAALDRGHAKGGPWGAIRELAQDLENKSKKENVNPLSLAYLYACVRDTAPVLHWLEKAYAEHLPALLHIKADPLYGFLHSDPRFQDLLRRIGFPEETIQEKR